MYRKLIYTVVFVFVFGLASRAPAALLAHWKLDEGSGTTAVDDTGNGHDGTLEGSPQWVLGYFGYALQFAGSPDRVVVPYSAELNPENAFTVSVWANVEPGSTGYRSPITSRNDGPQRGYIIYAASNNNWEFWIGNGSGWTNASGPAIQHGEWTHVAATYAPGDMKLYIDGAQAAQAAGTISLNTQQYLSIGAGRTNMPAGDYFYVGMIDDVRLYDEVLSEDKIAASMENQGGAILKAYAPNPPDGAIYEDTWITLSWQASDTAVSHNVYLGDNFDDVNDGTPDSDTFRGNQTTEFFVAGFPGFAYPDGLVPGTTYYWRIDEVNDADPNSPWKGNVWSFWVPPKKAYEPNPADGADYVNMDVELSWTPGFGSKLHTVYFGDNFEDVNSAAGGLPLTETTYNPGSLEKDMIYYWRVDEFDGAVTHKGDVWSFNTIPTMPITDPNLTGWWKLDEGSGNLALDWSGHDNHGNLVDEPQWVAGQFGYALAFDGSRVAFPSSDSLTADLFQGSFTVAAWINPKRTGNTWQQIFRAIKADNTSNDTLFLNNDGTLSWRGRVGGAWAGGMCETAPDVVPADQWTHAAVVGDGTNFRIYVNGELTQESAFQITDGTNANYYIGGNPGAATESYLGMIDDVRVYNKILTVEDIVQVMRGDPLVAWNPSPANGSTTDLDLATPLTWSPGDNASQHDVYFGTEEEAVDNADATDVTGIYRGRQSSTSYTPPEGVEWGGGPYYWRIDEVNTDGTISKGRLWSFSVADFILVDDFESYTDNDIANEAIWQHWIDGFGVPGNGAQVGYLLPPYAERTIVNSGNQSMPFFYDNTAGVANSEAVLTLTASRDWTRLDVSELSLWFRGYPASVGSFVEAPAGTYTMTGSGTDIWGTADQFHFAFKTLTGAGSIIAQVRSVQNTNDWAKAGVMIRETLNAGSKHAFACVTPANGVAFQGRLDTDVASFSTNQTGLTAPYWVKVERDVAGNFTVTHSANGTTWGPIQAAAPRNISMTSNVYIGLALTSHDAAQTCQAVFFNVTTTGNVSGQWAHQDIGIASNAAEPMYVAVSNSTGAPGVVANDDPTAATMDTWTEWRIPLQAFADQGINLANVDSIAIGLGSNSGVTSSGGSGTMYFDDIRLLRAEPEPQP